MLGEWFFELMKLKNQGLSQGAAQGRTMNDLRAAFHHFREEWDEFVSSYKKGYLEKTMKELADLSNMCDLFFEALWDLKEGRR